MEEKRIVFDFRYNDDEHVIKVWKYKNAPQELKEMSEHGGDEDWVALLPPSLNGEWIPWADEGTSFGSCSVQRERLPDGSTVLIGAHA